MLGTKDGTRLQNSKCKPIAPDWRIGHRMSKRKVRSTQVQEIPAASAAVQGVTEEALLDEIASKLLKAIGPNRERGEFTSSEMSIRWNISMSGARTKLCKMEKMGLVTVRRMIGRNNPALWKMTDKAQQ